MLGQTRAINPPRFPNYTRRWRSKKGLNLASGSFTRLLVKGENNWTAILDHHIGAAWQIDGANVDDRRPPNQDIRHGCLLPERRAQSSAAITADTVAPDGIAIGGTA
jgi:hypothetical protein